jgi:hypothetical protein
VEFEACFNLVVSYCCIVPAVVIGNWGVLLELIMSHSEKKALIPILSVHVRDLTQNASDALRNLPVPRSLDAGRVSLARSQGLQQFFCFRDVRSVQF